MFKKLIYRYKRRNNIQSPEQAKIIASEVEVVVEMAAIESSKEYSREYDQQKLSDGKCPLCGCTKVVNKITRVQGHGELSGSFRLGYGSVSGSMDIDTNDVNNCNNCGNQWKKYKISYRGNSKMLAHYLDYIETHIEGRYKFGDEIYKKLSGFKAETIYELIHNRAYESDMYSSTYDLSLETLREYFKSVFD